MSPVQIHRQTFVVVNYHASVSEEFRGKLKTHHPTAEVIIADDGLHALTIMGEREHEINTLISGVRGVGIGGLSLINMVRRIHPYVAIILTSLGDIPDTPSADACLSQPFEPSELLKVISLAERSRAKRIADIEQVRLAEVASAG